MANEFGITMKAFKVRFFPKKITDPIGQANIKAMRQQSGTIAKIARNSMRRVRKTKKKKTDYYATTSRPGKPPMAHAPGRTGLKRVLFALDRQRETSIIGPVRFNGLTNVPELMEFGGRTTIWRFGKKRIVHIRKRPFMGPAEEKARDKYPGLWQNSVGAGGRQLRLF